MSAEIVNHETGEIVETIGADEARRLTTEAQNEFRSSAEHFNRAWSLIEQAVEGGGHVALGYRSPGDYLHAEFDGALSGLDVSARRIAVNTMTEWGLSTRAIAQPLGVSNKTVSLDQRAPVTEVTPEPTFISATDALAEIHQAPATEPEPWATESTSDAGPQQEESVGSTDADESVTDVPPPAAPLAPVIGIDGKTYKRPAPKPSLKPVINEDEWTEQDRAEELAADLAAHLSLLFALTVPERRAEFIATWHLGVDHRPVLGQKYVKPSVMREIADALHTFASEWENANV